MRQKRIIIIGAGIGGLTAAGALYKLGIDVHVYERASELGEVGAGLQLGPNAVKVLKALGITEKLGSLATELTEIISVAWNDGHLRFRELLASSTRYGAPYLSAHRADLHAALQSLIPPTNIHLNARCADVRVSGNSAIAVFDSGREEEADALIGCDGTHSVVRKSLFGNIPARFTDLVAWRGVVPIECVPTEIGPGGSITIAPRKQYVGWIGPTGHVICYPIRGGDLYNLFIGHFTSQWAEESWIVPSSVDEIIEAHAGWNDALLHMLRQVQTPHKWGIYDRDPMDQWTSGRITLVGDAAHPMMPTLAQGAAITIEDAYSVARHIGREPDVSSALKAYEAERAPRARGVQLQSRRQFDLFRETPPKPFLSRDWIFEHDATMPTSNLTR